MSLFVEDSPWIFLIMTVLIGGGAAYLAGRNLAGKWRPVWMAAAPFPPPCRGSCPPFRKPWPGVAR